MTTNKEATRYASHTQESRVAKKLGARVNSNSGAGLFEKGDLMLEDIGMMIECKTCMTPKKSFSIKKEWLEKNEAEKFINRASNSVIAFNFDYEDKNDYYIIDDKLMKFLVEALRAEVEEELE